MLILSFIVSTIYCIYSLRFVRGFDFAFTISVPCSLSYASAFVIYDILLIKSGEMIFYLCAMTALGVTSAICVFFYSIRSGDFESSPFRKQIQNTVYYTLIISGVVLAIAFSYILSKDILYCRYYRCNNIGSIMGADVGFSALFGFSFFSTLLNQGTIARLIATITKV